LRTFWRILALRFALAIEIVYPITAGALNIWRPDTDSIHGHLTPEESPMSTNNPYAPPVAAVRDIPAHYAANELADLGPRLGAAVLDTIIFIGMVYVPILIGVMLAGITGAAAAAANADVDNAGAGVGIMMIVGFGLALIGFVAWVYLTIKYVNENGQSIAKKIVGIKVVRADGSPATLSRIFWLRNVVNALIGIVPLYGLIDILFIFSESRQCLHDKLADTIVIKA
jgi:uncharacterized RDD family membrane protein YckC